MYYEKSGAFDLPSQMPGNPQDPSVTGVAQIKAETPREVVPSQPRNENEPLPTFTLPELPPYGSEETCDKIVPTKKMQRTNDKDPFLDILSDNSLGTPFIHRKNSKRPTTPQEEYLLDHFPKIVDEIKIENIAESYSSRKGKIKNISNYALVTLVPSDRQLSRNDPHDSFAPTEYDVEIPKGTHASYNSYSGVPYLDTRQAVGLTYGNWLVALAGLAIDRRGDICVPQIQDVSGVKAKNGEIYEKTGLRKNGLLWRNSLVRAVMAIGKIVGSEHIILQSHRNSFWKPVQERGKPGYDGVAEMMGFEQIAENPYNGNWVKKIT